VENKPASSLVVTLGKALNGIASYLWMVGLVIVGGSLTWKTKRSGFHFLVEVPWHINEQAPSITAKQQTLKACNRTGFFFNMPALCD